MKKLAIITSAFLSFFMGFGALAASTAIRQEEVKADSGPTDITTSDPFHDLVLIYLNGNMADFKGPSDFLRKNRPNDFFQICGFRPYGNDLYIYAYFDNSSKIFPGFSRTTDYYALLTVIERGSGNSIASQETDEFRLTEVGTRWHSGAQGNGGPYYFVKFKAENVFSDDSSGKYYDIIMSSLGNLSGGSYAPLYDVEEEYSFSYDDENYDITAKWWANEAVIMDPTKGVVRLVKENSGSYWDGISMRYVSLTTGYYEDYFLFFDLSRTPDQIISIDFYYTEVTFYGSALKEYRNNGTSDISKLGQSYNVPEEFSYEPGNEIELKYAGTEWATKTVQRFKTVKSSEPAVKHSQRVKTWLPPFSIQRTVETKGIINLRSLPASMQDEDQRNWLTENGAGYHYAALIGNSVCDWTSKLDRESTYYSPLFPEVWNTRTDRFYLYEAHSALNTYALKMVVKDEQGKEASWNVFNHGVDIVDHVTMETHSATLQEWLVAVGKTANGWLVNVILAAYALLSIALLVGELYIVIKFNDKSKKNIPDKADGGSE